MSKFSTIGLLLVVLLFNETTLSCLCNASTIGCIEEERQALLKFKDSFTDHTGRLSSWHSQVCCSWKGLQCDEITGHVVGLDLDVNFYAPGYNSSIPLVANEVHSFLLQLKYLNHLDLARNDFHNSPIPEFFGSMARLRYLNLSGATFSGIVPHHLGNLSSLRVLDLNFVLVTIDDFTWVSRLSSLQYLDLSYMKLIQTQNLYKVLNMIPCLLELHLTYCGLDNIHLSHILENSTISNVQYLDLSSNSFEGELLSLLRNLTSLRFLDLSGNQFNSFIPLYLEKLKSLEHLNLHYNAFHDVGGMLSLMSNQCSLRSFDMSFNRFDKKMFISYGNLSSCTMYNLETLCSSGNGFIGHLPNWLGQLKHLKYLDLSREISKLWVMKFSSNKFSGIIPSSIGHLSGLEWLHLNNNSLYGGFPMGLRNCTGLLVLDLGQNGFFGNIPGWIGELKSLRILRLHKNMFNGKIPLQLCQLLSLQIIDLANNNLEKTITRCFGNLTGMVLDESERFDYEQWLFEKMIQVMKGNELEYSTTLVYLVNMDLLMNNLTGAIPAELSFLSTFQQNIYDHLVYS
ncbi:Receptor-like protein EIX2 [Camellia lanceoleosa]|uniref:Receptor-like protein EIX2 n=1 Tax=Camellia lanceoleosa TaxID=1840588 RepID=A0ACC0GZI8_9ERIC|nr:Receptor-like protein EIX2 [Camellia lanceoleosa]